MLKVFVWVVAFVAVVVGAEYDFQDSDFNELLFDDFKSAFEDEESLRSGRGAAEMSAHGQKDCVREKGKKDRDSFCCNGKADEAHLEVLREIRKECVALVRTNATSFDPFNCEHIKDMKEQCVCTAECIARRFNLVNEHGDMIREHVLVNFRAKLASQWKAEAVEGVIDKCLGELKAAKEEEESLEKVSLEKENKEEHIGCNPLPLQFTHCVWRKAILSCPTELRSDNGKCKRLREGLAKGDKAFRPF